MKTRYFIPRKCTTPIHNLLVPNHKKLFLAGSFLLNLSNVELMSFRNKVSREWLVRFGKGRSLRKKREKGSIDYPLVKEFRSHHLSARFPCQKSEQVRAFAWFFLFFPFLEMPGVATKGEQGQSTVPLPSFFFHHQPLTFTELSRLATKTSTLSQNFLFGMNYGGWKSFPRNQKVWQQLRLNIHGREAPVRFSLPT